MTSRLRLGGAMLALYLIWGSTYLAMRVAIEGFPPLLMAAVRHSCAGVLLFAILRIRGAAMPTRAQWRGGAITGTLLLVGGNGGIAVAERSIATGFAAVVIASVPLWVAVIGVAYGNRPTAREVAGLLVGFAGILALEVQGGAIGGDPVAFVALCISPIAWAWGSIASTRLSLAPGAMSSATQMLSGGIVLFAIGFLHGDRFAAVPSMRAVVAMIYLIVLGSLVAFSVYGYLLRTTRPAVATSYAYVNPIVAIALGVAFANEVLTARAVIATLLTLAGVGLLASRRGRSG